MISIRKEGLRFSVQLRFHVVRVGDWTKSAVKGGVLEEGGGLN